MCVGLLIQLDGVAISEPEFLMTVKGHTVDVVIGQGSFAGRRSVSSFQTVEDVPKRFPLVVVYGGVRNKNNLGSHELSSREKISRRLCVVDAEFVLVANVLAADGALANAKEPGTVFLRRFLDRPSKFSKIFSCASTQ